MTVKVAQDNTDRVYFTLVPNVVWAMCRDAADLAVWITVKQIAGEQGECFVSAEDGAALAGVSVGKWVECRGHLLACGALVGELRRDEGYRAVWHLRIPDLWPDNIRWREAVGEGLKARIAAVREARAKRLHRVKDFLPGEASPGEASSSVGGDPSCGEGYPSCGEGYPSCGEGYPSCGEGYPSCGEAKKNNNNNHKRSAREEDEKPTASSSSGVVVFSEPSWWREVVTQFERDGRYHDCAVSWLKPAQVWLERGRYDVLHIRTSSHSGAEGIVRRFFCDASGGGLLAVSCRRAARAPGLRFVISGPAGEVLRT